MNTRSADLAVFALISAVLFAMPAGAQPLSLSAFSPAEFAQSTQAPVARIIGTIKAINGSNLTIAPASGPEITAVVQPNARIIKLEPGEKDVKNATPIQLTDLQVGDTVRVRGFAAQGATSIPALEVLVITRSAVAAVGDQIREDWQKRGSGGLVTAVDPSTGTITISTTSFSGKKSIAIHTSKNTIFRRYSANSMKFEDAVPSSLAQVQSGDQIRARGDRNADGTELTADEVVTGSFRNIAGLVNSVDASAGILTVQDVLSKKVVQVKITSDSQLHQLPPETAQRIAMRLKGAAAGGMPTGAPGAVRTSGQGQPTPAGGGPPDSQGTAGGPRPGMGMRAGGGDLQQFLSRQPTVTIADLHKGDAVMIVATESSSSTPSTAINLLSGVEPILRAAPSGSEAMMMSSWSLGGMPGGADAGSQ
jgi:Domain of unknown function (DUF5666)